MRSLAVLGLASALSIACDVEPRPETALLVEPLGAAAVPGVLCEEQATGSQAEHRLRPGQASLHAGPDGLWLIADETARIDVLNALRAHQTFAIEIVDGGQLGPPLTAELRAASPEDVLALALAGAPHVLRYERLPGGRRTLAAVQIGRAADPPSRGRLRTTSAPLGEASAEELRLRFERSQAERTHALASADASSRALAAAWIHPDARTVGLLGTTLLSDPSPEVRAAAAESLGEASEERDAAGWLLEALEDPDSRVVLAALEALEWVGDASVLPGLEPLLSHPDPAVRDQAQDTIEWVDH
jgi:hypothetical protein